LKEIIVEKIVEKEVIREVIVKEEKNGVEKGT
jgi:hypothetical protein